MIAREYENENLLQDKLALVESVSKLAQKKDSRTCKSANCFAQDKITYKVLFFFGICCDRCKKGPRITIDSVSPWHLSMIRAKA
jgi:hypothetical protein